MIAINARDYVYRDLILVYPVHCNQALTHSSGYRTRGLALYPGLSDCYFISVNNSLQIKGIYPESRFVPTRLDSLHVGGLFLCNSLCQVVKTFSKLLSSSQGKP